MLSLPIRYPFTLFSRPIALQTASYVSSRRTREIARATEPAHHDTDTANQPNDQRMGQITKILENAASSQSPPSNKFATSPTYERVRRGRLPKDLRFLKPTDLLPREDPFRRKRALLGPGAAESRKNDWFYQLGIDPLDEAMNPRLLSYFVSDLGKMRSRADTKLTWRSQRRLTKAVRRAKMMGVMPILNKHISLY